MHRTAALVVAVAVALGTSLARADTDLSVAADVAPDDPGPATLDLSFDEPPARDRDFRALSLGGLGAIYATFTTWAYVAWYHDVPELPAFAVGQDGYFGIDTYAGGADKLGHFMVNYAMTRGSTSLLRRGGWKPLTASVIAGGLSALYFAFIEVKDGFYYELSPGDLIANTLGAVTAAAMENLPELDRYLDLRIEYWPSDAYRRVLDGEDSDINTLNVAEDYTGQKYLAALHLGAIDPIVAQARLLRYVDVVAGFRAVNYKPHDSRGTDVLPRRQELYLGVSLNAQAVWDRLFERRGTVRAIGHDTFEIVNVPFTSAAIVSASRSPDEAAAVARR
jgi:hypothetical protein